MRKILFYSLLIAGWELWVPQARAQTFEGMSANNAPSVQTTAPSPAMGKKIMRNPIINQAQKNRQENQPESRIILYYRNFKIDTTPSGRVMCDFDLIIHNSTPYKINTLNLQLVWPSIKTSASFYDVSPRSENYIPMTLMGKGCYSMDKYPNVVVNLCRIKGMSGEQCTSSIIWVKVK